MRGREDWYYPKYVVGPIRYRFPHLDVEFQFADSILFVKIYSHLPRFIFDMAQLRCNTPGGQMDICGFSVKSLRR